MCAKDIKARRPLQLYQLSLAAFSTIYLRVVLVKRRILL